LPFFFLVRHKINIDLNNNGSDPLTPDIEILLSVFDQQAVTSDHHVLNVKEKGFPKKYQHIIRRLQQAVAVPEVQQTMDVEDEILEELQDKERLIAKLSNAKDNALADKKSGIG